MKFLMRLALSVTLLWSAFPLSSAVANNCASVAIPTVADDGLTVTMNSISTSEKSGSYTLTISYTLKNNTPDKKIDEGSFKLFFKDGSGEPQYGGFNAFFPGDSRDRSYTWEYLKTKEVRAISYNAGFFAESVDLKKLNWVIPGSECALTVATKSPSPVPAAPTPSSSATPNPSRTQSSPELTKFSAEVADLVTVARSRLADATKSLTALRVEQVKFDADISSALSQGKTSLLPALNKSATDAQITLYRARVSELSANMKTLTIKQGETKKFARFPEWKLLLSQVQEASRVEREALGAYNDAIELLTNRLLKLEKARATITGVSAPKTSSSKESPVEGSTETTLVCVKGKSTLKVTGSSPFCPKGYKKK